MAEVKLKEETELWDPPNTKHSVEPRHIKEEPEEEQLPFSPASVKTEEDDEEECDTVSIKAVNIGVQIVSVKSEEEVVPSLEPPHIKEEPEEELLQEFPFTPVSVKTEDDEDKSSVLHQRPTEENREETNGEECGAEAGCSSDPLTHLHSDSEGHPPQIAQLDASFSEQGEAEDQDLSESRPDTPSAASTSHAASSLCGEAEETASTASTGSSRKGEKRKRVAEFDIELQKLKFLQKMVSKVDAQPTADALTAFGNQVVLEMRQIQDPGYLARLKKSIMIMIYDTQETSHAHATPFQPII